MSEPLPMGLDLRPQVQADSAWLRDLYASTRELEMAMVPWPEDTKRAFLDQQFELQRSHFATFHGEARFLAILNAQGAPIGRYIVQESRPEHLIVDIALFPQWRGQGIGSALIRQSMALATREDAHLGLHVLKHNLGAQRLYRQLGFEFIADEGSHWRMRWTPSAGGLP